MIPDYLLTPFPINLYVIAILALIIGIINLYLHRVLHKRSGDDFFVNKGRIYHITRTVDQSVIGITYFANVFVLMILVFEAEAFALFFVYENKMLYMTWEAFIILSFIIAINLFMTRKTR